MSGIHTRLYDPALLTAAWRRVRRAGGGPGRDGMTLEAFARNVEARLADLAVELRTGRWRPAPLLRIHVPKRDGGRRTLAIPTVRDRVVHTALALVLEPLLEPLQGPGSFAYRRGRSAEQALAALVVLRLRGYVWLLETDVARCFDSIPHGPLLDLLAAHVPCRRTLGLVRAILRSFSRRARGIPQGSPLSPLLANSYLAALDRALTFRGARPVRYADDLVVACRSREVAEMALVRLRATLARLGLSAREDRTRIVHVSSGLDFLGHRLRGTRLFRPPVPRR